MKTAKLAFTMRRYLAHAIESTGIEFRGLHYYDGHLSKFDYEVRRAPTHEGYDQLMRVIGAIEDSGLKK